jgi:hypothetical protein
MRPVIVLLACTVCIAARAWGAPGCVTGDPPRDGEPRSVVFLPTPFTPGGDVLRPDRSTPGRGWFLGPDLGVTYSSFVNGPMSLYAVNPYYTQNPALLQTPASIPLLMTVNSGDGFGWYIGATADVPLSDGFGLQLKPSVFTRMGAFKHETSRPIVLGVNPDGTFIVDPTNSSVTQDNLDWSFTNFGVDLLARIQLAKDSWYLLAGPSFNFLLSNEAKFDQTIKSADVYYIESFTQQSDGSVVPFMPNQLTHASVTDEVDGCSSTLVNLKAGLGTWIPLSESLFLTPELTFAYPLTPLIQKDFVNGTATSTSAAGIAPNTPPIIESSEDFRAMTFTLTLGLRWLIR